MCDPETNKPQAPASAQACGLSCFALCIPDSLRPLPGHLSKLKQYFSVTGEIL